MSIRVMSAVWGMDLSAVEKLVLLALADCANDDGLCWPSIATLAKKTGASERSVQRSLRSFEAAGILTREEVKGKGCRYFIRCQSVTPDTVAPPTQCHHTPDTVAPKPSKNHQSSEAEASSDQRVRKAKFVLPDHIPAEQWAAYEEMRRRIRKPMTDRARTLAIEKLDELTAAGWPPGDVLDQSVMNSWQGLFEIKDGKNGRSGQNGSGNIDRRSAIARVLDREIAKHYEPTDGQRTGEDGGRGGGAVARLAALR